MCVYILLNLLLRFFFNWIFSPLMQVLFKKVIPHHCLGSVWSRRDKLCSYSVTPTSVTATVNQFNAVSLRVISTVLSDVSLKPVMRAKIISKWINIAQVCFNLKFLSTTLYVVSDCTEPLILKVLSLFPYLCHLLFWYKYLKNVMDFIFKTCQLNKVIIFGDLSLNEFNPFITNDTYVLEKICCQGTITLLNSVLCFSEAQ